MTFLAAAAAVVAIGAGGVVWQQVNDDGPADRVEQIQAAERRPALHLPVGDGGSATVYRSKKLNEAVIVTKGMPAPRPASQYVLWLQHGDVMVPAGVMPRARTTRCCSAATPPPPTGPRITVEDAGTEPTEPSDDVVALFAFDA